MSVWIVEYRHKQLYNDWKWLPMINTSSLVMEHVTTYAESLKMFHPEIEYRVVEYVRKES